MTQTTLPQPALMVIEINDDGGMYDFPLGARNHHLSDVFAADVVIGVRVIESLAGWGRWDYAIAVTIIESWGYNTYTMFAAGEVSEFGPEIELRGGIWRAIDEVA